MKKEDIMKRVNRDMEKARKSGKKYPDHITDRDPYPVVPKRAGKK